MKVGFYPGCLLNEASRKYNESVKTLAQAMGLGLIELEDWNYCNTTVAHSMSRQLFLALLTRVLTLVEQRRFQEIIAPCTSCCNHLSVTQYKLLNSEILEDETLTTAGIRYLGNVRILNVIQMIGKYISDVLRERIVHPLAHQVICYYDCSLVRLHETSNFDRLEDPQNMDKIISLIGTTSINWVFKTERCGAGLPISRTDFVGCFSGSIPKDADDRGTEAMIVTCPMCHSDLDIRRPVINYYLAKTVTIPVLYVTQAIELAVELAPKELGLGCRFVTVDLKEVEVYLK